MTNLSTTLLREFDSASLTGTYQNMGAVISGPAIGVQAVNNSDVEAYITDGFSEYRVPPGVISLGQIEPFNTRTSGKYHAAKGTQYQIKQVTAAGTGGIWLHVVIERV